MEKDEEIEFISSIRECPKPKPDNRIVQIDWVNNIIVAATEDGIEQNNAKIITHRVVWWSTIIDKIGGMWAVVLREWGACFPEV